jgi:hypothetical protein
LQCIAEAKASVGITDEASEKEYHAKSKALVDAEQPALPNPIELARIRYHAQPMVKALRESDVKEAIWWNVEDFQCTREEYIQSHRHRAITTFAVVKDGVWYEKGDMGWFGIVADEKNQDVWNEEFNKLIDSLPDDTLLTVVDAHI